MFLFLQFWRVLTMFMSPWSMSSACLLCGWLWVLASMRRTLSWRRTILVARRDAEDHVGNNCSGNGDINTLEKSRMKSLIAKKGENSETTNLQEDCRSSSEQSEALRS